MSGSPFPPPATEVFSLPGFSGELTAALRPVELGCAVERMIDPGAALKTLHWGRNYLYLTRIATLAGPLEVVVKQFRHRGLRERLRRRLRGSKAASSWRVAQALLAAGIPTPEPVMLLESAEEAGPAFYVCRYLGDVLEARYLLRAANAGRAAELFPEIDLERFLRGLGCQVRRLHDAGFWHRDLSMGNLLLSRRGCLAGPAGPEQPYTTYLVDLNRARVGRRLTLSERARDLSRLAILEPEHQALFLGSYWAGDGTGATAAPGAEPRFARGFYLAYHHAFLWKNRWKERLRGGRRRSGSSLTRAPHAHIPAAPPDAAMRDKIVWDRLSDQPHQHAGRLDKLRVRLADARVHAAVAGTVARALPRICRRYRELRRELHAVPVDWGGAGVCLRPWPEAPEALLALVEELGARHLLIRLHPWQEEHGAEEELARELHRRGYELSFALPQSRELVRDPARWRASLEAIGERFARFGPRFQVGQAINRSKWGVWHLREYVELARAAEEVLRRQPGVELLGPAVIDFEFHVTAAVLNLRRAGFSFDAVSALLYVDRRGAPENRQAGLDTVDKVLLLKAIAETGRNSNGGGRCWITEVNWPLREGPHSPAGRAVAVDEQRQADYLARYYLLTLGTGLVERVFWWQLAARGYGLVDPADPAAPRQRPSFLALRTLLAQLAGTRLEQVLGGRAGAPGGAPAAGAPFGTRHADASVGAGPGRLFRFRPRLPGPRPADSPVSEPVSEIIVGWSPVPSRATLPRPPVAIYGRDGERLELPGGGAQAGREVELTPSPRYFHLAP
ncbi:MAG TPA: lipopolysaccharide kinase InaA family protein [Thermoanaerobaculia bacterium]|nr:lipopolysaccharide kinase InaA family protein [Thermoanaerobaculia bacterium]